jgi:hypothetical protein
VPKAANEDKNEKNEAYEGLFELALTQKYPVNRGIFGVLICFKAVFLIWQETVYLIE